jgi:hypothetical protein
LLKTGKAANSLRSGIDSSSPESLIAHLQRFGTGGFSDCETLDLIDRQHRTST